jgi:glutamyl-tRNA synthetase
MTEVRVRFAPSPTGEPHVGNIRTAIFNWLFARHEGGRFILRIEDTDRVRLVENSLKAILEGLKWLGMDWDEGPEMGGSYGPYFQSQRLAVYREQEKRLVEEGKAYYCACSPERLAAVREEQQKRKENPRYDRRCRDLGLGPEAGGTRCVLRLKVPLEGETAFEDRIRGRVVFSNTLLDDLVLVKTDGYPTYHFANVIDDHLMKVSHVMRGDDWISSTPRHVVLYRALGWEPPVFAHLSTIVGPDRARLSKRHGATSILEYRRRDYFPEVVFNFLSLLGWSPGDNREIMTREELIGAFSLEGIVPTAAIFDLKKLDWMNGEYMRRMPDAELLERVIPLWVGQDLLSPERASSQKEWLLKIIALLKERCPKLGDFPAKARYFFREDFTYEDEAAKKHLQAKAVEPRLEALAEKLAPVEPFAAPAIEAVVRALSEEQAVKPAQLIHPMRVALSGTTAGPGLFEVAEVLGKERVLRRLHRAVQYLQEKR